MCLFVRKEVETLLPCASPFFVIGQAKECVTKEKPVLDQKVYTMVSTWLR